MLGGSAQDRVTVKASGHGERLEIWCIRVYVFSFVTICTYIYIHIYIGIFFMYVDRNMWLCMSYVCMYVFHMALKTLKTRKALNP